MEAVEEHLDRDNDEQHTHEPLHGHDAAPAHDPGEKWRTQQDDRAESPREQNRREDAGPAYGGISRQHHDSGDKRWAGNERRRQGNDEWLLELAFGFFPALRRKDHAQSDQEQHDAAGDAQGFGAQSKDSHKPASSRQHGQEYGQSEQAFPQDNPSAPLLRHLPQRCHEVGDIPQRVHDQQQRQRRRKNVHPADHGGGGRFPKQRFTSTQVNSAGNPQQAKNREGALWNG